MCPMPVAFRSSMCSQYGPGMSQIDLGISGAPSIMPIAFIVLNIANRPIARSSSFRANCMEYSMQMPILPCRIDCAHNRRHGYGVGGGFNGPVHHTPSRPRKGVQEITGSSQKMYGLRAVLTE